MRATKAYIAGLGTTGLMLAASMLVLTVASALVAFKTWPEAGLSRRPTSFVVSEPGRGFDVTRPSVSTARAVALAARRAAAARARALAARRAAGATPGSAGAPASGFPVAGGPGAPGTGPGGAPPGGTVSGGAGDGAAGGGAPPAAPARGPLGNAYDVLGETTRGLTGALGNTVEPVNTGLGTTVSGLGGALADTIEGLPDLTAPRARGQATP